MHCNLLLVDDEPNIPRAIRRALRSDGYRFLLANSADEAFDLLKATDVDVIISDHRMPGMTGAEFLSEVSRQYPDTIRLMLSGQADFDAVIQAVNGGSIYKFLSKPWQNEELQSIVRDAATAAQARHIDPQTGWQTHGVFSARVAAHLEDGPLRIIAGEIRNVATVWALLDESQRLTLADKIEKRCLAAVGEPVIDHAALDRGLFAFAVEVEQPEELLEGLLQRLSAPMMIDDQALRLQPAFGFADSNLSGDATPEPLIKKAIVALASVNSVGPGYARYNDDSSTNLQLHQALEHDLSSALAKQQFFLQLQPQVGADSLCIQGAEALIRWRHPEHGLVPPDRFIAMAERDGLINDIGTWVMCAAMQHLETLADLGMGNVRVSVNVSPRQFESGSTASWVTVLRQYATELPHCVPQLEIEVTESTVMENPKAAAALLSEFKELGIRVALDDFGTGHSNLAQLKGFPLDVLKLDRSLLQDIAHNERSLTLVKHMVEMAKALDLEIVAEGIESDDQVIACRSLGCDLIQGYAFYKPLDIEDFYRVLRSERHAQH